MTSSACADDTPVTVVTVAVIVTFPLFERRLLLGGKFPFLIPAFTRPFLSSPRCVRVCYASSFSLKNNTIFKSKSLWLFFNLYINNVQNYVMLVNEKKVVHTFYIFDY